jgi:hypothetical protein
MAKDHKHMKGTRKKALADLVVAHTFQPDSHSFIPAPGGAKEDLKLPGVDRAPSRTDIENF